MTDKKIFYSKEIHFHVGSKAQKKLVQIFKKFTFVEFVDNVKQIIQFCNQNVRSSALQQTDKKFKAHQLFRL